MRVGVSTPKGQRNQLFCSREASPTRARKVGGSWWYIKLGGKKPTAAVRINPENGMLVMLFKSNGEETNWDCEFRCDEDARGRVYSMYRIVEIRF